MFYEKYKKYCEKTKTLGLHQVGGSSPNDYIFSFSIPPHYPIQINDTREDATYSWFYCSLI